MKRVGEELTVRILGWEGDPPAVGDQLETSTGRLYLILDVKPKRLELLVVPKDAQLPGRRFRWRWGKR